MHHRDLTVNYRDAEWPVRDEFAHSHSRYWRRLSQAGSWWSGAQRVDMAREVRAAWDCEHCKACLEALSPNAVEGQHAGCSRLPAVAIEAVHRITTDSSRLTRGWYDSLLARGLSEGQYIELLGTVVSIVSIDSFAIALGLQERSLPDAQPGRPDRYRPATAGADDAWVPMVAEDNTATPEADLWSANRTGNVVRALSLVAEEVRTLKDLSAAHYLAMSDVRKVGYNAGRSISRNQIELLAGRTSALNACFY